MSQTVFEVEVGFLKGQKDAIGESVLRDIKEDLGIKGIKKVRYVESYLIQANLSKKEVIKASEKLFIDPIIQTYSLNKPVHKEFDWLIEVRLHDNVTDNVGSTAKEGIQDLLNKKLKEEERIRTIRKYYLTGKISEEEVKTICTGLLANPTIETFSYRKGKK